MRFVKTAENLFGLPQGFTRVEYLESTGTQYIDTGFYGNLNTKIETKVYSAKIGSTSGYCIAGDITDSTKAITIPFNFTYDGLYSRFGNKSITGGIQQQNGTYTFAIDKDGYYVDDVKIADFNTTTVFATTNTIMLFGFTGLGRNYLVGKMYYCKIWDGTTLVGDFIPCIDPLGVACMYDLVGKKAYYNQGTGEFTVGRQIIPVEYLESTGTQYINTGYKPNQNTKAEIKYLFANISNYCLFGARDRSSNLETNSFVIWAYTTAEGGTRCDYFANRADASALAVIPNVTSNTAYIITKDKQLNYLDGVQQQSNESATFSTSNTAYLFCGNNNGSVMYQLSGKVYYCKIWNDGVLVRDFIPCVDENNVGFMFDNLSGTVYENAGTGAFIVGNNKYNMKLRLIKDNILPTGYTQVEYLEATGTQYIDTGFIANGGMILETKANQIDGSFHIGSIGPSNQSANNTRNLIGFYGGGYDFEKLNVYGDANPNVRYLIPSTSDTTPHKFYLDTRGTTIIAKVDEQLLYSGTTTGILQNLTTNVFIGYSSYSNATRKGRYFYVKIWDSNGTLARDFIPALDPSGTPCMYDLVTRTPFYNNGTGTFITGKPVLSIVRFPVDPIPGYKTVNYIESTGTQYIDTGVILSSTDKVEALAEYTGAPTQGSSYIFGTYGGSKNFGINADLPSSTSAFYGVWYNQGTITASTPKPGINTKYKVEVSSNGIYINDTLFNNVSGAFTGSNFAYLFWANGTSQPKSIMRLYYAKIWNNNTLVRSFIPVVRLIDNKAGMWDTVTKQFYTTPVGDFITG